MKRKIIRELIENGKAPAEFRQELSPWEMWSQPGPLIWKADRFTPSSSFYPVYRYQNLYSYSLLALIFKKGRLDLNQRVANKVAARDCPYLPDNETIDRDIKRIGGPLKPSFEITSAKEYARKIALAMRHDLSAVEAKNNGFTNIILCGGKDSLNLLLIPWQNPVIVASAPPNYALVKAFIKANGLGYDVICLDDADDSLLEGEILINCCRNDLEHCRWGPHLKALAQQYDRKAIFWKGQLGDTFLTPYWKDYIPAVDPLEKHIVRAGRFLNRNTAHLFEKVGVTQRYFFRSLWYRGAMWQGVHMAFLRELTGALFMSGYHGPKVQKVLAETDLHHAVQADMRPLIGKCLSGRSITYLESNPSPPPSTLRAGVSHLKPFLQIAAEFGLPIR